MSGNELLDKMELIDPAYIEEAERMSASRKRIWLKIGAIAAVIGIVIAGGLLMNGMWSFPSDRSDALRQNEIGAESTEPALATEALWQVELATEPSGPLSYHGSIMVGGPFENDSFLNVKPIISGYGDASATVDMSVTNGGVVRSLALDEAMAHYGDSANYRVLVELFSNGVQIPSGGAQAMAEAQRLVDLGYIVAMEIITEEVRDGEIVTVNATYLFTLHVTYEQMVDFEPEESLGYKFVLYDEAFGGNTSVPDVVYNGGFIS